MVSVLTGIAVVILLAGAAMWAKFERDRFLSLSTATHFRAWMLQNIAPIPEDPFASREAVTGATFLLSLAFDHRRLLEVWKQSETSAPPSPSPQPTFGDYTDVLRNGVRHTAMLAAFEVPKVGLALRELVNVGHQPASIRSVEPEWARQAADGVTYFARGRLMTIAVEGRFTQKCAA